MKQVVVICEGQTEIVFIKQFLAPKFVVEGINLRAIGVNTSPDQKGGALSYPRVKFNVCSELKRSVDAVTTLFDLYKIGTDFPNSDAAGRAPTLTQRLDVLSKAFHDDIVGASACRPERFLPYFQPHEIEALLFSDVDVLTRQAAGWERFSAALHDVRNRVETPEHINDGYHTKPSERLKILAPKYLKTLHGPTIAANIGLEKITAECPHFAAWIDRLRAL